ncbi:hypothetical protein IQ16_06110 [Bradyrhizobium huanghuaihaiense]|uniref:Uncharacterized protein n=1 Tax=Bradyrhizobium huanghuaihaiense TaxID=990078 RepID=A0A562R428_9BRAD|nr:hypothetical protein IQ16_06110 [Bradyrhizobium huanghuaihaiense]
MKQRQVGGPLPFDGVKVNGFLQREQDGEGRTRGILGTTRRQMKLSIDAWSGLFVRSQHLGQHCHPHRNSICRLLEVDRPSIVVDVECYLLASSWERMKDQSVGPHQCHVRGSERIRVVIFNVWINSSMIDNVDPRECISIILEYIDAPSSTFDQANIVSPQAMLTRMAKNKVRRVVSRQTQGKRPCGALIQLA